jgi:hypothetical protein
MTSQNQFLITVDGIPGFFATKSGGVPSIQVSKDFDGGSNDPVLSNSRPVYSDLTVGRRWDIDRDAPIEIAERKNIGKDRTITSQPCDADFVATGPKTVYRGRLQAVNPPDADANSSNPARFALVFSIQKVL